MTLARLTSISVLLLACGTADAEPLPHVRLGMTPRDVRDRLEVEGGSWQSTALDGETVLDWRASSEKAPLQDARFEFHLGMLVAIHARIVEPAGEGHVQVTGQTVTSRQPSPRGTELIVLSRNCPNHRDEAAALAARASSRP